METIQHITSRIPDDTHYGIRAPFSRAPLETGFRRSVVFSGDKFRGVVP